jgi:HEAT repeat protein
MSLYELERAGATEELSQLALESDSAAVRRRAAQSLGELEADETGVIEALVELVDTDPDGAVRAAAVDALDRIGEHALERLVEELAGVELPDGRANWAAAKSFVQLLESDDPELRLAAATVLGRLGVGETLQPLAEQLVEEPDPRVRARIARACGRLGDRRAAAPLLETIDDEHAAVRQETAEALGAVGGTQARKALCAAIDDPAEDVRRSVASALGEFESGATVPALVEALADENELVRTAAVNGVIGVLSNAPAQRSHEIREAVVAELSEVDDSSVVGSLAEVIEESTQQRQRRNAIWLLGRVAGADTAAEAMDALVDVLGEDDQQTAQFAATSIAEIGGPAESALLSVLDGNASGEAKAMAAFTLGKVGGERARKRLDDLVETTDDEDVRRQAFNALSKLGGRPGGA